MSTHGTIKARFAFTHPAYGSTTKLPNGSAGNGIGWARATLHYIDVALYESRNQEMTLRHGGYRTKTTKAWMESALTGLFNVDGATVIWSGDYVKADNSLRMWNGPDEITIRLFSDWDGTKWRTESITLKPGEHGKMHKPNGEAITIYYYEGV